MRLVTLFLGLTMCGSLFSMPPRKYSYQYKGRFPVLQGCWNCVCCLFPFCQFKKRTLIEADSLIKRPEKTATHSSKLSPIAETNEK